jgi:dimethylaniline monooxygenase (N-oxide forming)
MFDGKRKKWDGARQAIEKVNAELEAAKARAKNKKTQ